MARETRTALAILAPLCLIAITLTAIHFTRSAASAGPTTWYVDASVAASGDGQSPETPLKTIHEAIDAASEGDTVIVAKGTYRENIRFNGKNIVLRSTAPLDGTVVAGTIIDGNGVGSAVSFSGTEDEVCLLCGFTIRNGSASSGGGIHGGSGTRAAIENNIIIENKAEYGGGIAYCSGIMRNCLIAGNVASESGGGLWDCGADLVNNTIVGNSAPVGTGLARCDGSVLNCIIWGNEGTEGGQLPESSAPTFSCIQGWSTGGEGNLSADPLFVDADGPDNDNGTYADNDYRLAANSPCIDAGKNEDWMSKAVDLDGTPRIVLSRSSLTVDMGAYEYVRALEIVSRALPTGVQGEPYGEQVKATGGAPPYAWATVEGNLPDGLSLEEGTGFISGLPTATAAGTSTFTIRVTDARARPGSDQETLSITVMTAEAALDARFRADFDRAKTEVDDLIPEGSWWVENNPAYAASWSKFIDLIRKYPQKRDGLERMALEVLYRSRQFRQYNQLAEEFLARSTNAEMRRQILDWYLRSALEVPDATESDYRKVLEIADLLGKDAGYREATRLEEYRCLAEIRVTSYPPPESSWWVKGNPLFANSYVGVLALREGRPPSQLQIIEYEALKILFRSQQYRKFCELVDGFLPHMISPWRHTMVLDWYLHCASCWGTGDLQKTIEVGKLLENEPSYWDRGRIVNFVFDSILRYRGKEEAYPYLLGKLRRAVDEKEVLKALDYSYKHPGVFEGMGAGEVAALYRSKEEFISKTEDNVDPIVKLRMTADAYEAMSGREM